MNSEKLNTWLTLFANFGVLIGIALLVYELRQTQHLSETESAVRRFEQMQIAHTEMALSESLAGIRVRALSQGVDSLDPVERYRLRMWEQSVQLRMASQYVMYERGYLDEATAQGFISGAAGFLPYWEELGVTFRYTPFRNAVREAAERE